MAEACFTASTQHRYYSQFFAIIDWSYVKLKFIDAGNSNIHVPRANQNAMCTAFGSVLLGVLGSGPSGHQKQYYCRPPFVRCLFRIYWHSGRETFSDASLAHGAVRPDPGPLSIQCHFDAFDIILCFFSNLIFFFFKRVYLKFRFVYY